MQIIYNGKTGQTLSTEPLHLICKSCKTEIECVLGDMTFQSPHDGEDYYEIKCPICQRDITTTVPKAT